MTKLYAFVLSAVLLAAPAAFAGNMTFDNGQASWHSTQCTKPVAPPSVLAAHPETAGEDMNALITKHNAYVDAAQAYMNCISGEAEGDQTKVDQAIAASAQQAIAAMQGDVDRATQVLRSKQK